MERETGFEPATSTLARSHSTTELFPLATNLNGNTALQDQSTRARQADLKVRLYESGQSDDRRLRAAVAVHVAQHLRGRLGQGRVAVEPGGPLERAEPRHLGQDFDVPVVEIRLLRHGRAVNHE